MENVHDLDQKLDLKKHCFTVLIFRLYLFTQFSPNVVYLCMCLSLLGMQGEFMVLMLILLIVE